MPNNWSQSIYGEARLSKFLLNLPLAFASIFGEDDSGEQYSCIQRNIQFKRELERGKESQREG